MSHDLFRTKQQALLQHAILVYSLAADIARRRVAEDDAVMVMLRKLAERKTERK